MCLRQRVRLADYGFRRAIASWLGRFGIQKQEHAREPRGLHPSNPRGPWLKGLDPWRVQTAELTAEYMNGSRDLAAPLGLFAFTAFEPVASRRLSFRVRHGSAFAPPGRVGS